MKKILPLLFSLMFTHQALANIHVLACEPEWAALTKTIAGNKADIYSATTAMQDPHTIQAKPSLIAQARQADLLICTGAELEEGWLPLLLRKSSNPAIQNKARGNFMATDYISLLDKPARADRSDGDVHLAGNPHIQPNPDNLIKVANALLQRLIVLAPEHAKEFTDNHQQFIQDMQSAQLRWQPLLAKLKGKKVVVHHDNWVYMNSWIGLEKVGTLEPKPGVPPTTSHLAELLTQLQTTPANIIVTAFYQDNKAALWLSGKTGIKAITLAPTVEDWNANNALINWLDNLLNTLAANAS